MECAVIRARFLTGGRSLAFVLVTLVSMSFGCKTQQLKTSWTERQIAVDGKIDDWSQIPTTFFEEEGTSVGLCNDSENLYIHFRFRNETMPRTIRMTGLNIWVDVDGGKDQDIGIQYRGGPTPLPRRTQESGPSADPSTEEKWQKFVEEGRPPQREFLFIDKKGLIEAEIGTDGSNGPAAAYDTSMGLYSYEISIPLDAGSVRYYGLDLKPGDEIAIGAVWGEVDMDAMREKFGNRSGGMGGGPPRGGMGGGPPGGGMGGGRPGGPPGGQRPEMPEKQEIWVKTVLATPEVESGLNN